MSARHRQGPWRKKRPDAWARARVGSVPLFHDPDLQRAYWETSHVFDSIRARRYVEAVFRRAAAPGGAR